MGMLKRGVKFTPTQPDVMKIYDKLTKKQWTQRGVDICTYAGYILRIDCAKAEEGLKTTPNSECALNALAIDNLLEYARLYLDGTMQTWIDAEDSLELW